MVEQTETVQNFALFELVNGRSFLCFHFNVNQTVKCMDTIYFQLCLLDLGMTY